MVRIRKQHYVPKFYLRNFGDPLFCFDKNDLRTFSPSLEHVAFETDFYGIAVEGDVSIETALALMDGKFSNGYNELLTHGDLKKLSFEPLANFIAFLATQYIRTRAHRDYVVANAQYMLDEIVKQKGIDDWKIELNNFGKIGIHLSSLKNWDLYASIIGQMKFILLKNDTSIPFWTSDNPVFLINEFDQYPYRNLGIISRGIELHFPLTPTLGLIACDPSLYVKLGDSIDMTRQNVNYENMLQVSSSVRHLFSNKSDFGLATQLMKKEIPIADIDKCLPIPKYERKDKSRPDFWPHSELLMQIFEVMKKTN